MAALGGVVAWWQEKTRLPLNRRHTALALWGTWFATGVVFFSVANAFTLMHRYYLAMLAPPTAALAGVGLMALWRDYRRPVASGIRFAWLRAWLLPIAVAGTAGLAAWILRDFPEQNRWLTPFILITGLGSAGALALLRSREGRLPTVSRLLPAVVGVGLVAILAAPTVWAGYTTWHGSNGTLPAAGPDNGFGPFGRPGFGGPQRSAENSTMGAARDLLVGRGGPEMSTADPKLVAYLEQHHQGETFLFATTSAMTASPYILATGKPVAALGGFAGADPILTADQLAAMVHRDEVRYFLVPSAAQQQAMAEQFAEMFAPEGPPVAAAANGKVEGPASAPVFPGFGQSANTEWVDAHCATVPESEWKSVQGDGFGPMGMNTLFDCANVR